MNELDKYKDNENESQTFPGGPEEGLEGGLGEALGAMMEDFQRAKLRNWFIRTSIGAVVFGYLATQYSWARWILYIWIPLAVLSLLAILFLPKILRNKMKTMFEGGMQPGQNPFGAAFETGEFGAGLGEPIDVEASVSGHVTDVESFTVVPLREQLKTLEGCGVRLGEGRTIDDVLTFFGLDAYEDTPYELVLGVLGRQLEAEPSGRYLSPNAYSLASECIEGDGSYVTIVQQLARITGEPERVADIKDFIDPEAQRAELRYSVDGEPKECTPTYKDEWVDSEAVEQIMRDLVRPGHGFYGHDVGEEIIILYLTKSHADRMDDFIEDGLDPLALGA